MHVHDVVPWTISCVGLLLLLPGASWQPAGGPDVRMGTSTARKLYGMAAARNQKLLMLASTASTAADAGCYCY
jgi:hypothetical protein